MSRTKREKKEVHCTVTGCDICEANRINELRNKQHKHNKQKLKAQGAN